MAFDQAAAGGTNILQDARDFLNLKNSALLAPKSARGISGFVFDVPDTESVVLTSEITDHYTESNSFLNDHVVQRPIEVTLSGFIGRLVFRRPDGLLGGLQFINNRLEAVDAYLGELTPGGVQVAQEAITFVETNVTRINQAIDRTQNLVNAFAGDGVEDDPIVLAYNNLEALWRSSQIMTVQTPVKYFDDLAITRIAFTQNNESEDIIDIQVSLKQVRFAETEIIQFSDNLFPPRNEVQGSPGEEVGQVQGVDDDPRTNSSFLFNVFTAATDGDE